MSLIYVFPGWKFYLLSNLLFPVLEKSSFLMRFLYDDLKFEDFGTNYLMNVKEGGHACIERGKWSGKFYQLSINGCWRISSNESLFEGSKTKSLAIRDLA